MDVVLQRVRDEPVANPDPRFAVVHVPVGAHRLVHGTVEVVVVRELDVSADVPREPCGILEGGGEPAGPFAALEHREVPNSELGEPERRPQARRSRTNDGDPLIGQMIEALGYDEGHGGSRRGSMGHGFGAPGE
jgi:hypothetical protein